MTSPAKYPACVTESDFIAHADKGKIQRFSHEDRAVFTDASARSNTIDK
jgi:hypothetical protein